MIKPAIVAVGFNRAESMRRLLKSICEADYPFGDITLIISIDECSKSDEVDAVAREAVWKNGEKIIRRFPTRQGLKAHVLQCGDLSQKYKAVIILEDDLIVSPSFYHFVYLALNYYSGYQKLAGIALYSHAWNGYANISFSPEKNEYDTYLGQYSITWGQCWTKERWADFREWYKIHDGRLPKRNEMMPESISYWSEHSWGKYYISYMIEKELYYVIPYNSMSTNFSEIGQHVSTRSNAHQVPLMMGVKRIFDFPDPEKAVKYDIFFERVFDKMLVSGIQGEEICVNLNCTKKNSLGHKYMLTPMRLKDKIIASYGMKMKPIDSNVTNGIVGNEIFLYEKSERNCQYRIGFQPDSRIEYEMAGYSWRATLRSGIKGFADSFVARTKNVRTRFIKKRLFSPHKLE